MRLNFRTSPTWLLSVVWCCLLAGFVPGQSDTLSPAFRGTWKVVTVEFNGQERTEQHPFSILIIEAELLSLRDKENAEFLFLEYEWEETENGFLLINPQNAEQRIVFEWLEDGTARFSGANYVFYLERE